jgi:RNA polymerase sigma-70 factor, ECF subfamily
VAAAADDEEGLVARAQAGDMDALRPLFTRYAEPLYAVILPRLRDAAAAEDVLRDTFATALEKIGAFRWEGRGVYGWLRTIAVNKATDVHRRAGRTGRLQDRLAAELPAATSGGADEALIAEEERAGAQARVKTVLARLPERYRDALRLRLLEERPREECARALGTTMATFDVVFHRAVKAFRKHDEEMGA